MWSRRRRAHLSLAAQFLVLQLAVLLVVLSVGAVVSVRQADAAFRDTRGSRLRAAAENLASTAVVQDAMEQVAADRSDQEPDGERRALTAYAQERADLVGASAVYLTDPDGVVVISTDPTRPGTRVDLGDRSVLDGRDWSGDVTDRGDRAIAAEVPVLANGDTDVAVADGLPLAGTLVGVVVVVEDYPPLTDRLGEATDDLIGFLALGLALGGGGSWLLSRLVRRRTRGLEPAEIAALADQREALLTSIREGLVAISGDGVVIVLSESARELLNLPGDAQGRPLADLDLEPRVRDLLSGTDEVHDAVLLVDGRLVVVNRNPVRARGRGAGTVVTLRDRTELLAMQSELTARQGVTETLRAQTHEFSNQLHTISGLLQLQEYDEAGRLIGTLTRRRAAISDAVTERVDDPAVAALLIAKTSLAAERRVDLALSTDSALPRLDPELSADVGTVLGNLVDNAVDAVAATGRPGRVVVRLVVDDGQVLVQVADTGPGVPPEEVASIFRRGFTTKSGDPDDPAQAGGRGVGLALVRLVCERRGGTVSVHNEAGAVFTACLPDEDLHD
ncbi:sensor histidine kinase [Nocardioides dongkuii]|uniref:sensor histidine kinase n=1 Tax=Nocardioides dongkuii TaxID=2760089 RepID=UPI001C702DD8|nr:ATP-binding protein [Nocardioides dongkuii]